MKPSDKKALETYIELDNDELLDLEYDYDRYIKWEELEREEIMRVLSYFVLKSYLLENKII